MVLWAALARHCAPACQHSLAPSRSLHACFSSKSPAKLTLTVWGNVPSGAYGHTPHCPDLKFSKGVIFGLYWVCQLCWSSQNRDFHFCVVLTATCRLQVVQGAVQSTLRKREKTCSFIRKVYLASCVQDLTKDQGSYDISHSHIDLSRYFGTLYFSLGPLFF